MTESISTTPPSTEQQQPAAPPWGSDAEFNPEKAWGLIQGLRSDKEALQQRAFGTAEEFAAAKQAMDQLRTIEDSAKSDLERANESLSRWQADAQKWRDQAVRAQVQALATDFVDPSDAASALQDTSRYIDAGGQLNTDQIKRDLAEVLSNKPHWRKQDAAPTPRAPMPNPSQGATGSPISNDPAQSFAAALQQALNRG